MGWDEIKYSLNSTLGTASHKPLNTQLNELKTTVGATADAAGTATTGTVMGKLRNAIERLETIKNLIGATNNTGGSATAGTVMAKLNKQLQVLYKSNVKYVSGGDTNALTFTFTLNNVLLLNATVSTDDDDDASVYVTINNGTEFNSTKTYRDAIMRVDGSFTNAMIDNTIDTTNYAMRSTIISPSAPLFVNSITFRGKRGSNKTSFYASVYYIQM